MQFPKCAYPVLLCDTGPVLGYKGSAGLFRNYIFLGPIKDLLFVCSLWVVSEKK